MRTGHKRDADGGLDLDDPRPWRVDQFVDQFIAATKNGRIYGGSDRDMAKRILRCVPSVAEQFYRTHREDPMVVGYEKFDRRSYIAALNSAIEALEKLIEAGPLHVSLPDSWKHREGDAARRLKEDGVTQAWFVDDLKDQVAELQEVRAAKLAEAPSRPFTNDAALWSTCAGLRSQMFILQQEGVKDKKLLMDIVEAAWMDAGLPENNNARNGETLRTWISKYLKRLESTGK